MNFCSNCGSAALNFEIPERDNRPRYICADCHTIHYSNPKVVTGCLPIWEDRVLLCRRSIQPRKGFWNVPGGYLENGESVEEGAAREVWEEARTRVKITGVHAIFSIPHINQVYIHFLGKMESHNFSVGEESLEVRLFREPEIPWGEIAFTSSEFTLRHYFEDRKSGNHSVHIGSMEYGRRHK